MNVKPIIEQGTLGNVVTFTTQELILIKNALVEFETTKRSDPTGLINILKKIVANITVDSVIARELFMYINPNDCIVRDKHENNLIVYSSPDFADCKRYVDSRANEGFDEDRYFIQEPVI